MFGYICVNWPKERTPEIWQFPPATPYLDLYILYITAGGHDRGCRYLLYSCVLLCANSNYVSLSTSSCLCI